MKMAELDLSKVPTILLLQAWQAFSLYKREPIKQSASLHSSAPGSFHRHTPSSTYVVHVCSLLMVTITTIHVCSLTIVTMMTVTIMTIHVFSMLMVTMMTIHVCSLMMVTT